MNEEYGERGGRAVARPKGFVSRMDSFAQFLLLRWGWWVRRVRERPACAYIVILFVTALCLGIVHISAAYTFSLKLQRAREAELSDRAVKLIDHLIVELTRQNIELVKRDSVRSYLMARLDSTNLRRPMSTMMRISEQAVYSAIVDSILNSPPGAALKVMNTYNSGLPIGAGQAAAALQRPDIYDRLDQALWVVLDGVMRDIRDSTPWAYDAMFSRPHEALRTQVMETAELGTNVRSNTALASLLVRNRCRLLAEVFQALSDYYHSDPIDILIEATYTPMADSTHISLARAYNQLFGGKQQDGTVPRLLLGIIRRDPTYSGQAGTILNAYCDSLTESYLPKDCPIAIGDYKADLEERDAAITAERAEGIDLFGLPYFRYLFRKWHHEVPGVDSGDGDMRWLLDWIGFSVFFFLGMAVAACGCMSIAFVRFTRTEFRTTHRFLRHLGGAYRHMGLHEALSSYVAKYSLTDLQYQSCGVGEMSITRYIAMIAVCVDRSTFYQAHESLASRYNALITGRRAAIREIYVWIIRLGILGTLVGIGQAFQDMLLGFSAGDNGVEYRSALGNSIVGNSVAVWTSIAAHGATLLFEVLLGTLILNCFEPAETLRDIYHRLLERIIEPSPGAEIAKLQENVTRLGKWVDSLTSSLEEKKFKEVQNKVEGVSQHLTSLSEWFGSLAKALEVFTSNVQHSGDSTAQLSGLVAELRDAGSRLAHYIDGVTRSLADDVARDNILAELRQACTAITQIEIKITELAVTADTSAQQLATAVSSLPDRAWPGTVVAELSQTRTTIGRIEAEMGGLAVTVERSAQSLNSAVSSLPDPASTVQIVAEHRAACQAIGRIETEIQGLGAGRVSRFLDTVKAAMQAFADVFRKAGDR